MTRSRIPLWLKITYTLWVALWLVLYKQYVGWQHYLWLCHLGNIVIVVGLWRESPLLLSWQALSLLFADLIWSLDFLSGLVLGTPPIGAAWYMFAPAHEFPLLQKALSLFHLFLPALLIWTLARFGYDRRAIFLQILTCWIIFPISYLAGSEIDNVNWVYGLVVRQSAIPAPAFLFFAMFTYVMVLYVPAHLVLRALVRRPNSSQTKFSASAYSATELTES